MNFSYVIAKTHKNTKRTHYQINNEKPPMYACRQYTTTKHWTHYTKNKKEVTCKLCKQNMIEYPDGYIEVLRKHDIMDERNRLNKISMGIKFTLTDAETFLKAQRLKEYRINHSKKD